MISLPEGPFDLILADPGWRWNPWSWATGAGRSAERHYRTDPPESTKTIEVPAAKDCVLALWSISSMLPQALELMGAEFRVLQPGGLGEALDRTRVLVAPAAQAVAARNPRSHARPAARNQIPIRDLRPGRRHAGSHVPGIPQARNARPPAPAEPGRRDRRTGLAAQQEETHA